MCKLVEDYAREWMLEPAINTAISFERKEIAQKLWKDGMQDVEKISRLTDLPIEEVRKLFEGKTA